MFQMIGSEIWIGLKQLHYLTREKTYKLRVRLVDQDGLHGEGLYDFLDLNKLVNSHFGFKLYLFILP